jgi:hypothetical protein
MTSARDFLQHELQLLGETLNRLQATLQHYAADDPHGDGTRQLLAMQSHHQALLEALIPYADDRAMLLGRCYEMLMTAAQHHYEVARARTNDPCHHPENWWTTLDDMEYYAALTERLKALPDALPPDNEETAISIELNGGLARLSH